MISQQQGSKRVPHLVSPSVLVVSAVLAFVVQSACGSDDGKKKAPGPTYHSAGDGAGGEPGSGGSKSQGGDAPNGNGGEGATSTPADGGNAGAAGAAGGPGTDCPAGTADCDDNPDDCETDATLLTSCGACGVSCSDTNGKVICGDSGCEVTSCMPGFGDCNDSGTDGCETDLASAENCGVCQHDCGGGACTTGLCAGTQLGTASAPYRWALTNDAIYRFDCNTPGYGISASYSLVRTPLDGGAEVVMAADNKGVGGLTVDDQFVYWAVNGTPPAVFKKAHNAAAATVPTPMFEPVSLPMQLKLQGSAMYWTAFDGQIYTRALSANVADAGAVLVSAADVKGTGVFNLHQDFVTTPTSMYWVLLPTSGLEATIRSAGLNGKDVADVSGAITNTFLKLWVNGEDLYWVRATNAALDGAYHFKKGGSVEALVVQNGLNAVMTDGDYFYVAAASNALYRGPIAGGATAKLSTGTWVTDFVGADANKVYTVGAFTHGSGFLPGTKVNVFPK